MDNKVYGMRMKKDWKGLPVRFVELFSADKNRLEWWAVGKDIAEVLGYSNINKAVQQHVDEEDLKVLSYKAFPKTGTVLWVNKNDFSNKVVINESGIISLIFSSKMPEAKQFRRWMIDTFESLHEQAGEETFNIFDVDFEKRVGSFIHDKIGNKPKDFIKAKVIADKAVSTHFGFDKMVKKDQMTKDMKTYREEILPKIVDFLANAQYYGIDNAKDYIYKKFS